MSTWLSNKTIGLNPGGYGTLLGEAAFTSARVRLDYVVYCGSKANALVVICALCRSDEHQERSQKRLHLCAFQQTVFRGLSRGLPPFQGRRRRERMDAE